MITEKLHNTDLSDMRTDLSEIRKAARESVQSLQLPGAPDEAWRRIPTDESTQADMAILRRFSESSKTDNSKTSAPKADAAKPSDAKTDVEGRPTIGKTTFSLAGEGKLTELTELSGSGSTETPRAEAEELQKAFGYWTAQEQRRSEQSLRRANDLEENLAAAVNLAYSEDMYLLRLDGRSKESSEAISEIELEIAEYLELSDHGDGEAELYLPLLIVEVGSGVEADVRLRVKGAAADSTPIFLQVVFLLREESSLEWSFHLEDGTTNSLYLFEKSYQEKNSAVLVGSRYKGGGKTMADCRHALLGEGAELRYYSLLQPSDRETGFAGQKVVVEQYAPHTRSRIEARSVLEGKSRSAFVGTIKIPSGARGSEGYEAHRTLLLDSGARIESLPELEIEENEVSCSHASSIAEPDEEALHYMAARGISREKAKFLLKDAFIEALETKMPH